MATVKTIRARWKDLRAEDVALNEAQVQYVAELAARTGVNIARWSMKPFCEDGDYTRVIRDRNRINRVFFAKMDDPDIDEDALVDHISDQLRAELRTSIEATVRAETEKVESEAERIESRIASYQENLQHLEDSLRAANDKLAILQSEKGREDFIEERISLVSEVLSMGWYNTPIFTEQALWLLTGECVLSERNRAAGLDEVRNLGIMSVRVPLHGSDVRVYPYKNNLCASKYNNSYRYYHPHVATDGRVCWGTSAGEVKLKMASRDYMRVLTLLHAALTTYNPANPYVELQEFEGTFRKTGSFAQTPHLLRDKRMKETKETTT